MFTDALIMDRTWDAPGGFLAFSARFARTGIQMYDGADIDPDGEHKLADGSPRFARGTLYPVDRPAEEVFSPSAMASFIAKPLTNDHPAEGVTIDNWNAKTKGVVGEVLRDGEFARLSGLMTDKGLIADYRAGKKQLSGGYSAKIIVGDGVNAKGEAFVAKQTAIDGNHVAFVRLGRAGPDCAVADAAPCSAAPQSFLDSLTTQEKPVKKILLDGLTVDIADPDTAERTVNTLREQRDAANTKVTAAEAKAVADAAAIVAKDAEIAKLTKDLADAKLTPQQMRDAGKAYALVCGKAKAAGVAVTDAMDEGTIMKAVVDKAMPGNSYEGEHVRIAFDALTKDVKVDDASANTALNGIPASFGDAATDYATSQAKRKASIGDAWKTPFNTADAGNA